MKVFAHRGLSSKYPENTLIAFEKALEYQIDGIETDVQLTKDGQLVIIHDEILTRTTGHEGFVKDFTLKELKEMNANNHYEGRYEIPTLDELLTLLEKHDVIINLELKTSVFEYNGIEKLVYDEIIKHNLKDRIIISSFNHESLLRMKEIDKSVKCGILTADRIVEVEDYISRIGVECYHPFFASIKPERVALAHKKNIEVNVWTVDDPQYFNIMQISGVDCVITNCCDKFCKLK